MTFDTEATLWRIGLTGEQSEVYDLLPWQRRQLALRYPEGSRQRAALLTTPETTR